MLTRNLWIAIGLILLGTTIYVVITERKTERLEIQTIQQEERIRVLMLDIKNSIIKYDSLTTVLDTVQAQKKRYEDTVDSTRNSPNPVVDKLRTANQIELERYFLNRYK